MPIPSLGPNRFWGRAPLPEADRTPRQKLRAHALGGLVAELRLYDPIDSYGGEFGVSAKEFAKVLDGIPETVNEIRLHINSPGGEVFEGIAIANSLRNHKARVVAHVDGIAASSASFIAASADEVVMGRNSQMMVHDAMGFAVGNAKTMADMVAVLDKISDNIASFYAEKAGGSVEEWRAVMLAETWFSASEAVDAGLADSVDEKPEADAVTNRFDLSIFNYAGRENAPAPIPPSASAVGSVNTSERGSAVAFTAEQLTNMRQDLGLAGDADEATIVAALSEALTERADPPASPPTPPAAPVASVDLPGPVQPATPSGPATPGTMVIDESAWQAQQERIKRLEAVDAKRRREERDSVIAQAVSEGKFPHARAEHWVRLWDADPEGTRVVIDGLSRGVVPVNELGHGGGDDGSSVDDEFAHIFPPAYTPNGA